MEMARGGEIRKGMKFSETNVACDPPSHLCSCALLGFAVLQKVITTSQLPLVCLSQNSKGFSAECAGKYQLQIFT